MKPFWWKKNKIVYLNIKKGCNMPALKKETIVKGYGKATINDADRDHSNDPFIVKKVEAAKSFLNKNGLPAHMAKMTSK
jgi:hypothetical protein